MAHEPVAKHPLILIKNKFKNGKIKVGFIINIKKNLCNILPTKPVKCF